MPTGQVGGKTDNPFAVVYQTSDANAGRGRLQSRAEFLQSHGDALQCLARPPLGPGGDGPATDDLSARVHKAKFDVGSADVDA